MKNIRKKQSKKVNFFLGSVLTILLILALWGTKVVYASLIAADQVTNDFQVSDLKGNIKEDFVPPTKEKPLTPGSAYPKKVTITNPNAASLFVRVLVTPEIQTADGILLPATIGKELSIDLGKDWSLGEDGYYYYLGKVDQGQTTGPLFTQVTLIKGLDEAYNGANMSIHIKNETIIAKGKHYREAWWNGTVPTTGALKEIDTKLQTL